MRQRHMFKLSHPVARSSAIQCVQDAPEGYIVRVEEPSRTLDQNAAQWPILESFADQKQWPINGQMQTISADDWKDILTCAFRNEQPRVAMGLNGGMVLLGQRTSKFGKQEFSEWMEFLWATANERGVVVYQDGRSDLANVHGT